MNAQDGGFEISALQGGALGSAWIVLVAFTHNFLLGGSLGGEIGWRGLLLPELLRRMPPLTASLVLGVIGGLWHLPIDLYAGFAVEGAGAGVMRIIYVLPLSVLFTWFYLRSKGRPVTGTQPIIWKQKKTWPPTSKQHWRRATPHWSPQPSATSREQRA